MPTRPTPAPAGSAAEEPALRRKLADLVARKRYSEAIRVRGQALLRRPELELKPSEAQLWCLEGRQAAAEGQAKRAEAAFRKALDLGLEGEPLERLARLWLDQGQTAKALALLEEAFAAGRLPKAQAGALLKLLFLSGETERARALTREHPQRFLAHQLQWAAGVFHLLAGDPVSASRQFATMMGAVTSGDHGSVWRAWASMEAGDTAAAAAVLKPVDHPAQAAVALDLAARTGQLPADLIDLSRRDLPRRDAALALALVQHLRQGNLLSAAQLLLANERPLLAALPELAALRRPLLVLAGQQALERDAPEEAIACWRPIVDRPRFDPELALRLYPLLDACDDERHLQECERLVSQLLAWLRRAARANPSDWPEPLLSTTLARLLCWQVDQTIPLGERQRTRSALEEARRLAPELADVIGRRGMLAYAEEDDVTAASLLWQALDGGCQKRLLYDTLEELLACSGQEEEAARLRRQHGPRFGESPESELDDGMPPVWLEALSQADLPALARVLRNAADSGAGLDALHVFLEHVPPPTSAPAGKLPLALPAASDRWDALLSPLSPSDQVEALTAILLAIQRFCRRVGRPVTSQIALRLAQLQERAARTDTPAGEAALRALLLLHGLSLKRSEAPGAEAARLLRRAPQPHRTLPLALLDLRLFASTKPWRALAEELHRQEPHNPLLTLALATMERSGSLAYGQRAEEAFDQARRQQDGEALAACRRERWWRDTHSAPSRRRPLQLRSGLDWDRLSETLDLESILRQLARERGEGELSDEEVQKALPVIEPQVRRLLAQMAGDDPDDDSFEPPPEQDDPSPRPRPRSRRRSFMDL
ncbi:MAG: hypothetical protein VKO44_10605 [Cyanobacteriota bacterium]|nr:hypothetical protein [Cyanobacteriota bacterium]